MLYIYIYILDNTNIWIHTETQLHIKLSDRIKNEFVIFHFLFLVLRVITIYPVTKTEILISFPKKIK